MKCFLRKRFKLRVNLALKFASCNDVLKRNLSNDPWRVRRLSYFERLVKLSEWL
ncbi:hypothetical protein [Leptospira noguchii]|uniref:Uncharacterized protein n=1 Tax=Leptospira noguchii TaxID=28182 RepID=A0AAE9GI74_9LEPT|nr:hypothetical protein [Leptospira noguchii]UOG32347.1 hypothetical protein MAL06_08160 [Leptospira noguchii]UOG54542.1 hypothetical protein MAL09_11095 [Leptospira noguchii]UOG58437.1 hypothetical protein MAL03_08015 [Leptospira noguchii]